MTRAVFSSDEPPAGSHSPGSITRAADTSESIEYAVQQMVRDAINFDDAELSIERSKASEYYKGLPFGDEEEGRSQVVLTEVRDAVQQQLPSLVRVFFSSAERVVEFTPRGPNDEAAAQQKTDYVTYVITEDNPGFLTFLAVWKDALVRRRGIAKWWWEDRPRAESETVEGLSPDQIAMLEHEGVEVTPVASITYPDGTQGITAHLRRQVPDGRARIAALPPEEFLQSRNARSLDDALVVAHRRELRRSDLVQMGVPESELDAYGGASNLMEFQADAITRAPNEVVQPDTQPLPEDQKILYVEAFPYIDEDGDGIAELRKICLLGTGLHVIHGEDGEPWDEPWPERPFALYVPDPEPHTMLGLGTIDATADIQRIKSHVMRGILDSASQTLHPRTWMVENQVNVGDIMNPELGAVVRMRAPGMAGEFLHDFVGQQAFPVLGYMDDVKEQRTGITKASAGLDPDALQSTTRVAVDATIQAAQQRLELLCRTFAETGHKQLMLGVAKLLQRHQPRGRMVKLRGQWVEVNPSTWDPDPQVTVNVGLGTGQVESRIAFLTQVAQQQQAILMQLGPSNPVVTLPMYCDTLGAIMELGGYKNTERFFAKLPADWKPPAPPPPPPTPEQVLAQVEQMKAEKDIAIKQADQALRSREITLKDQREQDRLHTDAFLGAMELELKYKHQADANETARLKAMQPLEGMQRGGGQLSLTRDANGRLIGGTIKGKDRQLTIQRDEHGMPIGASFEGGA